MTKEANKPKAPIFNAHYSIYERKFLYSGQFVYQTSSQFGGSAVTMYAGLGIRSPNDCYPICIWLCTRIGISYADCSIECKQLCQ